MPLKQFFLARKFVVVAFYFMFKKNGRSSEVHVPTFCQPELLLSRLCIAEGLNRL